MALVILSDAARFTRRDRELSSDDSKDVEELCDDIALLMLRIVESCLRDAFAAAAFVATEARLRDEVDMGVGEIAPVALNLAFADWSSILRWEAGVEGLIFSLTRETRTVARVGCE